MTSNSIVRFLLTAALAATPAVVAQAPTYSGVGGRFEQQLYAIQRNWLLNNSGTVNVPFAGNNRRVFVRFLADTSRDVSGFSIQMHFGILGEVVPAWLYTADAQDRPASAVLTGQIGIGTNLRECRASFPDKYTITANRLYFMAFELPAGENVRFANATGGPATSVTYFVTANGTAQTAGIKYGVNTGGYSPQISVQQPHLGMPYTVGLTRASLNDPAVVWFTLIPPGPARDLTNIGAIGSFLYLDLATMLFGAYVPGEPDRSREVTFLMPYQPSLIGTPLYFQWQVGTGNLPSGFVTSDLATCVIQ